MAVEKRFVEKEVQTSSSVLLVRPASFGFHPEAAQTNAFACSNPTGDTVAQALKEFDGLAEALDRAGVEILILQDSAPPARPDAVFPNNWCSFHADGTVVLYPMATEARRIEREVDRLTDLLRSCGFDVRRIVDLSFHEGAGHYLEGTGSLILDRSQRRAFASLSPRTDPVVIADFDDRLDYSTLVFEAHDRTGQPIYHTNVLLSLGTKFAVICSDALADETRPVLLDEIEASGRTIVEVDFEQLQQFACNLIELKNRDGHALIALSAAARRSFRPDQLRILERFGGLVEARIPTIEVVGGGSVRCMIADIHLPRS